MHGKAILKNKQISYLLWIERDDKWIKDENLAC